MSTVSARERHTVLDMDPVRNPYAPGAGQRPPELAGRDTELSAFDVVLERIAHGRPERSLVLTGLRGVGKTVLLNQLRSAAISRGWGTGKIEARPEQSLRRPVSSALHMALRELGPRHRDQESIDEVLGVLKAFALRETPADAEGARPLAAGHRRARRDRPGRLRRHGDRPRRAAQRRRRAWPPTSAAASRCSSTRCRTCSPTTSPRSAPPATSCRSRARR